MHKILLLYSFSVVWSILVICIYHKSISSFSEPQEPSFTSHTSVPVNLGSTNTYCTLNTTPCAKGYDFAKNWENTFATQHIHTNKQTFIITLPYQDFYNWFSHWQRDIFSQIAMTACSNKCSLVYDEPMNADAALFIMKPHPEYSAPFQVILNVEPYLSSNISFASYATYLSSAQFQVSYAFSETTVNINEIGEWYPVFQQFSRNINKTSLGVAWVTNTCDRHDNYLARLMNTISMDMYGPCFNNKNEDIEYPHLRDAHRGIRKVKIGSDYKFYISLENTIIPHYVTEKFYQGLIQDSVMVYLGAPNIHEYQPAHNSFVNALNFDGPESLGKYLLYLNSNPSEYHKYKAWKRQFATDKNLKPAQGFLRAVNNSFERTDAQSLLCRICNSLE